VPTNKIVLRRNLNLMKTTELSCSSSLKNSGRTGGGLGGLGAYKAKSIAQAANIIIGNVGKKYKRPIGRKSSRAEQPLPFKSVDHLSLESGERQTTATTIKKKEGEQLSGSNSFRVDVDLNSKQKEHASPRFSEDMDLMMQTEELPLQR